MLPTWYFIFSALAFFLMIAMILSSQGYANDVKIPQKLASRLFVVFLLAFVTLLVLGIRAVMML